eukprot:gnl/TRDRNA2_/TRDRNA2_145840_c0_seq4.p1 gnl/TRDRNA2_/TRDRNA2_145840_c0~~gnl/TRDRNA2_/TRDRNA2_145840_c0_seq4.p1  ORF type:complete len:460 (-),score=98.83 gnl/TRDRNA2_/TRDRNA2_145840_c0_seq4:102-1481(-)
MINEDDAEVDRVEDDEDDEAGEGDEPVLADGVQQDLEERLNWRRNAPLLYDVFVSCTLEWPALSVAWLPDEPDEEYSRLAFGVQTDGTAPQEVVVVELDCSGVDSLADDPWTQWSIGDLGEAEGFGITAGDANVVAESPLRVVARLLHPTEVNRIAPCPHRSQLLATKASDGAVLLYDYKADRPAEKVSPDATLAGSGTGTDGFALAWSPLQRSLIASGNNDGHLYVWDVASTELSANVAKAPLLTLNAHDGALCDLSFSHHDPSLLSSVGDDRLMRIWDARAGSKPQTSFQVSNDEVFSIDCAPKKDHVVATASKDSEVCVWDLRSLTKPLHRLKGHAGEAVVVRWSPFKETLLSSCSSDSRLIVWDLSPGKKHEALTDGDDDPEVPELLFSHGGHAARVTDLSWSGSDHYLMSSVAEDNSLHIWQMQTAFYLEESDGEGQDAEAHEPPTKRSRVAED